MSKHLKNIVIDGLKAKCAIFVSLPPAPDDCKRRRKPSSRPQTNGVRYFTLTNGVHLLRGAMDPVKDGQARRKRIIVRPSRFRKGLHELYTYHFPKHWSAGCVANRELIKEAQRQAHALEHDHSSVALDWRVRFFHQLYALPVWTKDRQEVPVEKRRYPHFYSYVFVTIYHQLRAEQQAAQSTTSTSVPLWQEFSSEISFEPIPMNRPFRLNRRPWSYYPTSKRKNLDFFLAYSKKKSYLCTRKGKCPAPVLISFIELERLLLNRFAPE